MKLSNTSAFGAVMSLAVIAAELRAGTITLALESTAEQSRFLTNSIAPNEVAKVTSIAVGGANSNTGVSVEKDGIQVRVTAGFEVAGPANIVLMAYPYSGRDKVISTIRIEPDSFPPDKTIVIPEGGGANITMECSTNLIDWAPAVLGVYTNQPANKFFRLRAERVP